MTRILAPILLSDHGMLFFTNQGPYLEYCPDEEENEVFCVVLSPDIIAQFDLSLKDVHDLCESQDEDPILWRKRATNDSPIDRAKCVVDVGHYVGWYGVDDDPIELTATERHNRWYGKRND